MMAISAASIPPTGSEDYMGHRVSWRYDMIRGAYEFRYMGELLLLSASDIQTGAHHLKKMLDTIHNQKGVTNGLSRQTAQAVPSHTNQSLAGTANPYQNTTSQQQLAQIAAQQQFAYYAQYMSNLNAAQSLNGAAAKANPEPLKIDGIKLGEIIAFRGWKVTDAGFLRSMSADVIWGPGEPMEGKIKSTAEHNGVYAYKTARDFLKQHAADLDVYGKVALWGDIIEHELGYRAQFAKVISLEHYLKREDPHKIPIEELRQKYCAEAA